MIIAGQTAPDFKLEDQDGTVHTLADYHGKWLLLYFYPKDDTPGCTTEACQLRDNFPDFQKLGIAVIGISADTVAKHKKFQKKYQLPFTLLADPNKEVLKSYGVWAKKKFMGKEYMGILRHSFLINPQGVIEKVYENVKPEIHAHQVLTDLKTKV